MNIYATKTRDTLLMLLKSNGAELTCGGEAVAELIPGSVDGAHEKHVPVITQEGNLVTVTIGEVDHPALPEHHIEWIALETKNGIQCRPVPVGEKAQAVFALVDGDEVVAAYEHCNLHGLWKKQAE